MKNVIVNNKIEFGNLIDIKTIHGNMRLIFNEDGTFRVITDLKCQADLNEVKQQLDYVLKSYQTLIVAERFNGGMD